MVHENLFFEAITLETTSKGVLRFVAAAQEIPSDAMVNIAYIGADAMEDRLQAIDQLRAAGLNPRPIVSARRMKSGSELDTFLNEIVVRRGLRRLFLVSGDPVQPVGPFEGALALIEAGHLDGLPLDGIGLPGYPEGHPIIPSDRLTGHLLDKMRALEARGFPTTDITTQICLDPTAVVAWIRSLRVLGIEVPIRVGVPSPTDVEDMLRFCRLCRVEASAETLVLHGWTEKQQALKVNPDRFVQVLLEALDKDNSLGAVHLHLFPMTTLPQTLEWFRVAAAK